MTSPRRHIGDYLGVGERECVCGTRFAGASSIRVLTKPYSTVYLLGRSAISFRTIGLLQDEVEERESGRNQRLPGILQAYRRGIRHSK